MALFLLLKYIYIQFKYRHWYIWNEKSSVCWKQQLRYIDFEMFSNVKYFCKKNKIKRNTNLNSQSYTSISFRKCDRRWSMHAYDKLGGRQKDKREKINASEILEQLHYVCLLLFYFSIFHPGCLHTPRYANGILIHEDTFQTLFYYFVDL